MDEQLDPQAYRAALRAIVKFEGLPRGEESARALDRFDPWWNVRRRIGWAGAARRDPTTFRIDVHRFDVSGYAPWIVGFFDEPGCSR
jgi:hypothetical protein